MRAPGGEVGQRGAGRDPPMWPSPRPVVTVMVPSGKTAAPGEAMPSESFTQPFAPAASAPPKSSCVPSRVASIPPAASCGGGVVAQTSGTSSAAGAAAAGARSRPRPQATLMAWAQAQACDGA